MPIDHRRRGGGIVVCFSGGLDSLVLCEIARAEQYLTGVFFVDYGQPAREQERRAVESALDRWNGNDPRIMCRVADLPIASVGSMFCGVGVESPRIVAGRNQIIVSHAVNWAASIGAAQVWIGATAEDQSEYADCTPDFVWMMSQLARPWAVTVRAPLIDRTRRQIVDKAQALGVDFSDAWSCYQPTATGRPCGTCNSCQQGKP